VKRIVIADDSETARMFIRRCLEIVGLQDTEFVEAENGKVALARLKEMEVDLLITDLNMPVMDGEVLLKWVKANPRLTVIPVLIITSAANEARVRELKQLGAYEVLNKPISPAKLVQALAPLRQDG
jgi:two-component system chemotaxis response regulator CheY